jgi:hypothetical protein
LSGDVCVSAADCQSGNCTAGTCQSVARTFKAQLADTKSNKTDDILIHPRLNIVNFGATSLPLSEITLRYWYTHDGVALPQTMTCDQATVGCGNLTFTFTALSPTRTWSDYYIELGFNSGAGALNAGQTTNLQVSFRGASGNYNEIGDYSYDPNTANPEDWVWVTAYRNGALVWGVEPVPPGTAGIRREVWTNRDGNLVSDLTTDPRYPNNPTSTELWPMMETPRDIGDLYGTRLVGWITAPVSGNYTFWISSDDAGELWLSTDATAANKVKIAYVVDYAGYHDWTKYPAQKSALIALTAGQRYYIEALHKERYSGDYLSVRWQLPDGTIEEPIGSARLTPLY